MMHELILELVDGQTLEAALMDEFNPDVSEIEIHLKERKEKTTLPFSKICCILFKWSPIHIENASEENVVDDVDGLEEVETVSGKRFQIRLVKTEACKNGFFAIPIDKDVECSVIFFLFDGVVIRNQQSRLCEILEKKGLVCRSDVEKMLEQQKTLRSRRVGDIITEQNPIEVFDIEKAIQESQNNHSLPPHARVGDILVAEGLVTRQQVDEALATQQTGKRKQIGQLLVECGFVTEDQILSALSTKFRMKFVRLDSINPHRKALQALPMNLIRRLHVFPVEFADDRLVVATSNPADPSISNIIRFSTNQKLELVVAASNDIDAAIRRYYPDQDNIINLISKDTMDGTVVTEEEEPEDMLHESDSKVVRLLNHVLIDAYEKQASDIHLEPGPRSEPLVIRYRTEGYCKVIHRLPAIYKKPLISRLKIISGLDITEHRKPQSGKILFAVKHKKVEFRVEITPTVGGNEDAVLRVLSGTKAYALNDMEFSPHNMENLQHLLRKPYGILLCVGPTGSGKTTTLHAALDYINSPIRKIWTVEDPVEITQPGLRQVQVHVKAGYTFQEALRSFLRADPDVIMVGEMRDSETAQIAIKASLTGHLVLSTLHTNSAPETIVRLAEMGIDPLNFSDALLGILSQRLTLRLCDNCKTAYHPTFEEYEELVDAYGEEYFMKDKVAEYSDDLVLMKKTGCEKCDSSGYKGRIALHELLTGSEEVRVAIKKQYSAAEIRHTSLSETMRTIKMDGIRKIFLGLTDLGQVMKVCA